MSIEPIVLLIDLDGTMIGDITPQIEEYYLIKDINKRLNNINKKEIKYKNIVFQEELDKYIIRPYFKKFLKNVKKYENIELFIYTASIDKWAKFVIPKLEKIIDFKFNRPILTRNNLYNKRKSINKVKPLIFRSLKKDYNLKNITDLKYILLIDNTKNILIENSNLIKCPSYNYIHPIDYLRNIPKDLIKIYYNIIENYFNLPNSSNVYEFYSKYYTFLKKQFNYASENNTKYLNDIYWKRFSFILKQNISHLPYKTLIKILKNI
jgi:hypothetical protein